jgi:hypothetical protein
MGCHGHGVFDVAVQTIKRQGHIEDSVTVAPDSIPKLAIALSMRVFDL